MNLIFHDRTTTAQQHTGLAFLTIEKAGSFVFSAAAVAGAQLLIGSAVALAQDTDSNIWYLVTSPRTQDVAMPFTLRSSGTNNGGRLCFSSAQRAKAFLAAHGESRASIRLVVGSTPMEHDGQRLWPLTFTGPVAIAPAAAAAKPACHNVAWYSIPLVKPAPEPLGGLEEWAQGVEPAPFTHEAINAGTTPIVVVGEVQAKRGGVSRSGEPLRLWTALEDDRLKRDYASTSNKVLATVLGRSEKSILIRAGKFRLKKAVANEITLPPALAQLTVKSVENEEIHPGLEAKFLKLVAKLGPMKIFKMDHHEAKQALLLLTNNIEKLALVPGAEALRERLAVCFKLPTQKQKMEGSVGRG